MTGDILEIGAFQAIRSQDVPAFERYLSLLGTYYNDLAYVFQPFATVPPSSSCYENPAQQDEADPTVHRSASLPRSVNERPLLALSLLRLLSENRIAEFHTLLETVPKEVVDSPEVAWVINVRPSPSLSLSRPH